MSFTIDEVDKDDDGGGDDEGGVMVVRKVVVITYVKQIYDATYVFYTSSHRREIFEFYINPDCLFLFTYLFS